MPPTAVSCPICRKQVPWNTNSPFRPFCSERCKKIDLGAWASGSYAIAQDATEEKSEDTSDFDKS